MAAQAELSPVLATIATSLVDGGLLQDSQTQPYSQESKALPDKAAGTGKLAPYTGSLSDIVFRAYLV